MKQPTDIQKLIDTFLSLKHNPVVSLKYDYDEDSGKHIFTIQAIVLEIPYSAQTILTYGSLASEFKRHLIRLVIEWNEKVRESFPREIMRLLQVDVSVLNES